MVVPRGTWNCLVCTTQKQTTNHAGKKSAAATTTNNKKSVKDAPFTKAELKRMFQAPPPPAKLQQYLTQAPDTNNNNDSNTNWSTSFHTPSEKEWEIVTRRAKALLWHKTLTQSVPSSIQSQMSNWRQAQTALETLTRTKQNRQHFLENSASSRGSQELAQTLVKSANAKLKMRQMVMNLEHIRANPEFHSQQIRRWCQGIATAPSTTTIDTAPTTDTTPTFTAVVASTTAAATAAAAVSRAPPKSFMERILFPFGQYPARSIPRTAEIDEENAANDKEKEGMSAVSKGKTKSQDDIPREIITNGATKKSQAKKITESEKASKKSEITLDLVR